MNIDEENKAKEFYIKSEINGTHTPSTNMVEINYLDLAKLMHSYAQKQVENINYNALLGVVNSPDEIKAEIVDRISRKNLDSEGGIQRTVWYERGFEDCIGWLKLKLNNA